MAKGLSAVKIRPEENWIEFWPTGGRLAGTTASIGTGTLDVEGNGFSFSAPFSKGQGSEAREMSARINALGRFGREPGIAAGHAWGRRARLVCAGCGAETRVIGMMNGPEQCAGCQLPFKDPGQVSWRRRPVTGSVLMVLALAVTGLWIGGIIFGGIALVHLVNSSTSIDAQISKAAGHREISCQENNNFELLAGSGYKFYVCKSGDLGQQHDGKFTVTPFDQSPAGDNTSGSAGTVASAPCIMTSEGNQVCGQAAVSWCKLALANNAQLSSGGVNVGQAGVDTAGACVSVYQWSANNPSGG